MSRTGGRSTNLDVACLFIVEQASNCALML